MKRSTTRRNSKIPVFHVMATKLDAVKEVNRLITTGLTQEKAIGVVKRQLKVHRTTVVNWMKLYGGKKVTRITPTSQQDTVTSTRLFNNHITTTGNVNSLTLNLEHGPVKLTPKDIRDIAGINRLIRWEQ